MDLRKIFPFIDDISLDIDNEFKIFSQYQITPNPEQLNLDCLKEILQLTGQKCTKKAS